MSEKPFAAVLAAVSIAACASVTSDPDAGACGVTCPAAVDGVDGASEDGASENLALRRPKTGIWYETWYTNQGHYHWATDVGVASTKQFIADVNHDGFDDAVTFTEASGRWDVALSNRAAFAAPSAWATRLGIGSQNQFMADVNGDGYPDPVMYFAQSGTWYAALSNGRSTFDFLGYTSMGSGIGAGSTTQLMADVNGDHRADAVTFDAATGTWTVALSDPTQLQFLAPSPWATGLAAASTAQFAADVDGDGAADAVAYFAGTGQWIAGRSSGHRMFGAAVELNHSFGQGSTAQLVADFNDDGKADALAFCGSNAVCGSELSTITAPGTWYIAASNGTSFVSPPGASAAEHGYAPGYADPFHRTGEANAIFVGDVRGLHWRDPIIFSASDGSWWAHRWDLFVPSALNAWEWAAYRYRPLLASGEYGQYDSSDATEIDYHLDLIHDAQIDFLVFDETNVLDFKPYIKNAALAACARIAAKRAADTTYPRYAIAIGKIQYTHDPADLEYEANEVWTEFVNAASCGGSDTYATYQGKPLLVVHALTTDRDAWTSWSGDKSSSDHFTIKWSTALVGPTLLEGCNTLDGVTPVASVATSEDGSWLGWASLDPASARSNPAGMFVQPGWNQQVFCPTVSRDGTQRYQDDWSTALGVKPAILTIASFNDYSEETAVAPTDTSLLQGTSEPWSSPDAYWSLTVSNNRIFQQR